LFCSNWYLMNGRSQTVEHHLWLFLQVINYSRKCFTHLFVSNQVCVIHQHTALTLNIILYVNTQELFSYKPTKYVRNRHNISNPFMKQRDTHDWLCHTGESWRQSIFQTLWSSPRWVSSVWSLHIENKYHRDRKRQSHIGRSMKMLSRCKTGHKTHTHTHTHTLCEVECPSFVRTQSIKSCLTRDCGGQSSS